MLMKSGQKSSVIGRRSDKAIFVQPRMGGLVLNGFAGVGIDSANKKYSKKWRERREKTMPKHINAANGYDFTSPSRLQRPAPQANQRE